MEERRNGTSHAAAIDISMTKTATATLTAALAAGLAYGSLIFTGFRGFNQFGVIGLIGMVLCWFSAYSTFPAFLTVIDRWRNFGKARIVKGRFNPFTDFFIWLAEKHYRKVLWFSAAAVLLAGVGFLARSEQMIELDLRKLRDKRSMTQGSGYNSKYANQIFRRYLTPIVIMPRQEGNAVKIVKLLQDKMEAGEPGAKLVKRVYSIHDFLPTDQQERIEVLKKIRGMLPRYMVKRLSKEDRALVRQFLRKGAYEEVTIEDLPPLILQKFSEQDGTIGRLVLVEPPLGKEVHQGDNMIDFIQVLRDVADTIEKGTPVAGQMPIIADMVKAIRHDGPRATLFAFLAVAVLVMILFRTPRIVGLCLSTLLLGVGWLMGIIMGYDLKINFLNFIALPITFGIGVDYGVNIFQRYRLDGRGSILKVLRRTGGAVGLASFTTIVGYGALLIAGNQAFVSFGLLAVLGEITCLFAAVVTLPAYLYYRDRQAISSSPDPDANSTHDNKQQNLELAAAK